MKCPICQQTLFVIGDYGNTHSSEIKPPIGWDCPTKTQSPRLSWDGNEWYPRETHYSVRGARATVLLYPFKIETWRVPEEYPGVSTVYYHTDKGWEKVWSCPAISIEPEEKLLARLKLLLVFS